MEESFFYLVIIFFVFGVGIGYMWGNSNKGLITNYTNELPNGYLRVINIDKTSSTLEEVNVMRRRFLVTTEVFGEKPIRPGDIVRKIKTDKERKDLGIRVLGYPPLVKDLLENFEKN